MSRNNKTHNPITEIIIGVTVIIAILLIRHGTAERECAIRSMPVGGDTVRVESCVEDVYAHMAEQNNLGGM